MPIAVVVGTYAAVLGIVSFFSSNVSERDKKNQLNSIEGSLTSLQGEVDKIQTLISVIEYGNARSSANTALSFLDEFAATDDADLRVQIGRDAVRSSSAALEQMKEQTKIAIEQDAEFEVLAYAFASLHYVAIARQLVAATVQDGPLGAAGLHESIKEAMELLFNTVGIQSIYDEFGRAISERITDTADVNFLGTVVDYTVTSSLTGNSRSGEVSRTIFEPRQVLQDRYDAAIRASREAVYNEDVADLKVVDFRNIGGDANQWLAQDSINVRDIYEQIGTSGADEFEGTSRADYMTGRQGDDILSGEMGPDALNGGDGNDVLRGGPIQDVLTGGPGNDMLFGNETYSDPVDEDTARFAGLSSEYEIEGGQTYAIVTSSAGERDKLFNIEFLRFDDGLFDLQEGSALDGAGDPAGFNVAERVALLYEAALNRDGNIDLPGLNFYIGVTEANNLTDEFLARDLMTSPEFTASFGDAQTLSNEDFLQQVYVNVLERDPDIDGFLFYLNLLDDGVITKELALADIAISPENTEASGEILMSLFESTDGFWSFV